jgi:hypothetical protein
VVEQVFGNQNALAGEHFRDLGADTAHVHDGSIEFGWGTGHTLDATRTARLAAPVQNEAAAGM